VVCLSGDRHTSQYQVLTRLAQFSLAREPHTDKIETPKAAVSMAKKTSLCGGGYRGAADHLRHAGVASAPSRR
jgi:hypothetical protein